MLGHALLTENTCNHLAITSAAFEPMLEYAVPTGGEIVDVAGYLVGHHQRKIGAGGLYVGCSLGLQAAIDWVICRLVGFVDRGRPGFLLDAAIASLRPR